VGRINVLDENTSNKIAAGEVVERPSSVVKELVENSIDAGAKNISVEILEGGHKSIKIIDDGYGIHPDDIEKVFMSHATSKINNIEDIYSINTLGFRGEALASIAAVSNTTLITRTQEFDFGKGISISGGNLVNISEVGANIGTNIEVNDLFFNVPARQKFLKSPQREGALISDIIERLSLANSRISFKMVNNEKKVLSTYSTDNITETIRVIYGKNTYENIFAFQGHGDIASVYGYLGNAELSRGSRNNQSIFVNKRFIKNKLITTAVETAFKSFLTINKYPFFVLFLDIYPEFIDVNVHPTKSEIKFRDERMIFKLVFDTVHEAIKNNFMKSFDMSKDDNKPSAYLENKDESMFKKEEQIVQIPIDLTTSSFKGNSIYDVIKPRDTPSKNGYEYSRFKNTTIPKDFDGPIDFNVKKSNCSINESPALELNTKKSPKFNELNVIGQFNSTYILAENNSELYIIDQHAAHEKILFEKYMNQLRNSNIAIQSLITPVVIELNSEDYSFYAENEEIFTNIGFNIEVFGENTISIREVPIILGEINLKNFFLSLLDNLKNMGTGEATEIKYNKIATMACKAAIKANDTLSYIEMKTLIEELRFIEDPFTCPHGRPTIIKITLNELGKRFKRIQ
jgi:DNA mismatch repair protein MutL